MSNPTQKWISNQIRGFRRFLATRCSSLATLSGEKRAASGEKTLASVPDEEKETGGRTRFATFGDQAYMTVLRQPD